MTKQIFTFDSYELQQLVFQAVSKWPQATGKTIKVIPEGREFECQVILEDYTPTETNADSSDP